MLKNAFDLIATEGTLRNILRAVTFSRDLQDRLRVSVDNTVNIAGNIGLQNASNSSTMAGGGLNPTHWGSNSWNSVDARYAFGEQQIMNFIQNRERWTIS